MPRDPTFAKVLVHALAGLLLGSGAAAQSLPAETSPPWEQEKQGQEEQSAPPAVLSGRALKIGAELKSTASEALVKWARSHAKREILKGSKPPADDAAARAIQAAYPKASDASRKAGETLVWFVAYEEGTRAQEIAALRVKDIERDMGFLQDDLRRIDTTPTPISEVEAARQAEGRVRARLYDAENQRDLHRRVREEIGKRVDLCLARLAALTEGMKDGDAAEIRGLK